MGNVRQPQIISIDWLNEGPLAVHVDAFKQYLTQRGYARNSFANCMGSVAHFAQWIDRRCVLDDIDWRAGTITLRHTKGRREDVLPLPATTGTAIAAYLKDARPKTSNRAVFVRHLAPRDRPVGPDLVRKTIRQAYARAGLPYTRSHLLRHTMANRLLAGGSSLKEVADVLRHRSLNTTLIYAKLDSRKLVDVALPWPGSMP
jgi:site-specific recombinase XerD